MRIMSQQRLVPQAPDWGVQENGKEMLLGPEEWGSIWCSSVPSPTHLSRNNTFRNPFDTFQIKWEVYFSKELCPLVFIVLNMSLHACVLCGYITVICIKYSHAINFWKDQFKQRDYNEYYLPLRVSVDLVVKALNKYSTLLRAPAYNVIGCHIQNTPFFSYPSSRYRQCIARTLDRLYIFSRPPVRTGCNTRSNCKRNLTGLNSEFYFLLNRFPYKTLRAQSTQLLSCNWKEKCWMHTFFNGNSAMWNANSFPQHLNSSSRVNFLWR